MCQTSSSCLVPAGLWNNQRPHRCLESQHPGPRPVCVFGFPPPESGAAPAAAPGTRGVGRHRQHDACPSPLSSLEPQTGTRMTGQSATSRRHLAWLGPRRPSVSLPNSWLSPRSRPSSNHSPRGPCLGPTACVASESGRLRCREAAYLGMRARDHHRSGGYEAGAKLRSPGHPLSSLLDRRSVTEFLSISLSISSFCRRSAAYFVCCLPGRGGRGGKGQLPKSGSQPGLHPAPPCHTKRAPSSACSPVPGTILGAAASQESRACAQTSRRSKYAIVTWKSSHVRGAWGGGTSQGAPCQCNGFLISSDVAKTPFCERRDS